jgi:hypothetical protein
MIYDDQSIMNNIITDMNFIKFSIELKVYIIEIIHKKFLEKLKIILYVIETY